MPKYETIIRIINEGLDNFDAGERAGDIIDGSKLTDDIILTCEPTRPFTSSTRQIIHTTSRSCLAEI